MRQRSASAPPPSSPAAARWLSRSARHAGGLLVVAALLAVAATPALAAPSRGPTPSPTPTTAGAPADNGQRSWAIRPATNDKPDHRTHLTLQATPGTTLKDQVLVTNDSKVEATFNLYGTDAFNTPTGAFDLLPAASKPVDIGTWLSFPAASVTIPAGGSVVVPFTIAVPASASPGDHTGGVVVSLITGTKVRVDTRVAVRLYLRVAGFLRPTLAVQNVSADYRGSGNPFGKGRVTVTYTVTNPGNIRLRSHPKVSVKAWYGSALAHVSDPDLPELLPGQHATFTAVLDRVFPAGPLDVKVDLQPYPDKEQPVGQAVPAASGGTTVWAVSWVLLLMVVVLLLAIGVLVWFLIRRRRRRVAARPKGGRDRTPSPQLAAARSRAAASKTGARTEAVVGAGTAADGDAAEGGPA